MADRPANHPGREFVPTRSDGYPDGPPTAEAYAAALAAAERAANHAGAVAPTAAATPDTPALPEEAES